MLESKKELADKKGELELKYEEWLILQEYKRSIVVDELD